MDSKKDAEIARDTIKGLGGSLVTEKGGEACQAPLTAPDAGRGFNGLGPKPYFRSVGHFDSGRARRDGLIRLGQTSTLMKGATSPRPMTRRFFRPPGQQI